MYSTAYRLQYYNVIFDINSFKLYFRFIFIFPFFEFKVCKKVTENF